MVPLFSYPLFTLLLSFPVSHAFLASDAAPVSGGAELKAYFHHFGYIHENIGSDELSDDQLETALLSYQRNLGLSETGKLDSETMTAIGTPRCGVRDFDGTATMMPRRYAYFNGQPRWLRSSPMTLTYAFSPVHRIDYLSPKLVKAVFARAFARWSEVIPVNFTEIDDYTMADIRIGWYRGDHGDGEAFDGELGVLAHAFSPEYGRFHLDAAETWAVDFSKEKSKTAVHLESVATHEIGHILGLGHSSIKEAIMYPNLSPRTKKVDLQIDDVNGIQALYGSNPNYQFNSRVESDISAGRVVCLTWTWMSARVAILLLVALW